MPRATKYYFDCESLQPTARTLQDTLPGGWVVIGRYFIYENITFVDSDILDTNPFSIWQFAPDGTLLYSEGNFITEQYTYSVRSSRIYVKSGKRKNRGIAGTYHVAMKDEQMVLSRWERVKDHSDPCVRKTAKTECTVLMRFQGYEFNYDSVIESEFQRATAEGGVLLTEEWMDKQLREKERLLFEQLYADNKAE